jgi:hypothetical protein
VAANTRTFFSLQFVRSSDIDERKRAEERLQQENVALREEIDKASMFEEIVGTSPALKSATLAAFPKSRRVIPRSS